MLNKITNLIKKTGDRFIVADEKGDPKFVIMDISEYEKLVLCKSDVSDLTEDELLDKINRDIAIWQIEQKEEEITDSVEDFVENVEGDLSEEDEEEKYYFEPVDDEDEINITKSLKY